MKRVLIALLCACTVLSAQPVSSAWAEDTGGGY